MPKKSNHNCKEKYSYVPVGTLEPMHIIRHLKNKTVVFCRTPAFYNASKTHNHMKFCKEVKTITIIDIY